MDKYNKAILSIINEQQLIIGPLALDLARKTPGIQFLNGEELGINGDPKMALDALVSVYSRVFGNTSVKVSKDALRRSDLGITPEELPESLR